MKLCYIINFWFGDRRRKPKIYDLDRLIFLKKQIENLYEYKNSIDTVIFNFNLDKQHYNLFNEALNIIPKYINNTIVKVNIRENHDFSYGAWNDVVKKELDNFTHFIFNEDDYIFNIDKWDEYLLKKYTSLNDCGYLGMGVRNIPEKYKKILGYDNYPEIKESFHSVGMVSSENVKKILNIKNNLIEVKKINKYEHDTEVDSIESTQTKWSSQYYDLGLKNYDVREDYAVEFQLTDRNEDIWRLFWWNENVILKNLFTILEKSYVWYQSYETEYQL
jgi:hypothetical protein